MRDLEYYQKHYDEIPYEKHQVKFRKKKVKEILSRYKHSSIIEIGCGLDSIMNHISDFTTLRLIEPGKLFYEKAMKDTSLHIKKDKILIYNEYFELWKPMPDSTPPDFILISCLLHELENAKTLLEKAHSISGKDTVIHIDVPNANSFHRLLAVEMGLIKDVNEKSGNQMKFQQFRIFDLKELKELAENSGFKIIESGSFSFKPFSHKQMADMINAGFISEDMLEGFYKMEKYLPGIGSEIYIDIKKA